MSGSMPHNWREIDIETVERHMTKDLISRADAQKLLAKSDLLSVAASLRLQAAFDALPAVEVGVKPLESWPTTDGAGHDHGVTVAVCPVSEKRFWAETPDKQPKIEAKRAARIRSALTATPAQDVAGLVAALDKTTAHGQRIDCSHVGHILADASWHVHLAGFRSRDDADAFLSAALARMKEAGE